MSFENPRDIPRTWVLQGTPRDYYPPLAPGTVYGVLPKNGFDPDSRENTCPEARLIADEIECELTPGFERHIRDRRQLKPAYEAPAGRELSVGSEQEVDIRIGAMWATAKWTIAGILPDFGYYAPNKAA